MACKYKYKGFWYTEEEIRDILGNEFYEDDKNKISELIGRDLSPSKQPIRNKSIRKIFDGDLQSLDFVQSDITEKLGKVIYIGSNQTDVFEYREKKTRDEVYVPEVLHVAIDKLYNSTLRLLRAFDKVIKEHGTFEQAEKAGATIGKRNRPINAKRDGRFYQAYNHVRNFSDYKKLINHMYPETLDILQELEDEGYTIVDTEKAASVYSHIEENDKINREKSQSKYVKLLTNFIEYDINKDKDQVSHNIIRNNKFVYKVLLDTLTQPLDTENLIEQIDSAFSRLIDVNVDLQGESPKAKKYRAIHNKLVNLITNQIDIYKYDIIADDTISKYLSFTDENTFHFDPNFQDPIFSMAKPEWSQEIIKNKINRPKPTGFHNPISTYQWLKQIQEQVNSQLPEGLPPITIEQLRNVWLWHYNSWIIMDLLALINSQTNSNPIMMETSGPFGRIEVAMKPTATTHDSYSQKQIILNRLTQKFLTKERIKEFKEGKDWKVISKMLDPKNKPQQKLEGIKIFLTSVLNDSLEDTTLTASVLSVNDAAAAIRYLITNHLDDVTVTDEELAAENNPETEVNTQDEELVPDTEDVELNRVTASDVITKNANQLANHLASFIEGEGEFNIAPMGRAADGTSYYPYANGSFAENLHDIMYNITTGKFNAKLPNHFAREAYKLNPYVNGKLKVGQMNVMKGNKYYSRGVMYKKENAKTWFLREFSGGFLNGYTRSNDDTYLHFYPPISNKPNIKSVQVTMQGYDQIADSIEAILDIMDSRPSLEGRIKNFKRKSLNLFNALGIVEDKVNDKTTNKELAKIIRDELLEMSVTSAKEFVIDNQLHISQSIVDAESKMRRKKKITDEMMTKLFNILNERGLVTAREREEGKLSPLTQFYFGTKEVNDQNQAEKTYEVRTAEIIPTYAMYFMNNYINTFLISHIVAGDPAFFKHEDDFIKRLSGPFSPGTKTIVNPQIGGSKPTFRTLVIKEDTQNVEASFFEKLMPGATEAQINRLISLFDKDGYDRSDAQGLMLESRLYDIQKGLGPSYGQGTAAKPVYYGHRAYDDGEINTTVPTMIKYAQYTLRESDELVEQFPKVQALIKFMKKNNIDEVVFESGVKVGSPDSNNLMSIEEIIEAADSEEMNIELTTSFKDQPLRKVNGKIADKRLGIMTLSNDNYRMQQNPNTNQEHLKKVNSPTQLTYVINVANRGDQQQTESVYNSLYSIFKIQSKEIQNATTKKLLNNVLNRKLVGENNEVLNYFLEEGIDLNFPSFYQKASIMFSSYVSDSILSTPFEGGKFQLITDSVFINPETGNPLDIVNDGKQIYAEVLVPRKFKKNFPLNSYFGIDGFSVRIPTSGLHSSLPFKVVGYIDEKSDVFVGPQQMVPIQGSDFDADSVQVYRDITYNDFIRRSAKVLSRKDKDNLKDMFEQKVKEEAVVLEDYIGFKDGKFLEEVAFLGELDLNNYDFDNIEAVEDLLRVFWNKQNIINNMKSIISNPSNDNVAELLSPINMGIINAKTDSAYAHIAKQRGVSVDSLTGSLDLGKPENKFAYYRRNFDGNALTGIFANLFKAVSYIDKAGVNGERPKLISDIIQIDDRRFTEVVEHTTFLGEEVPVRAMMDTLINLAIDNVKEQGLPTINASGVTANVYVAGLMIGIPLEDMIGLMLSPMAMRMTYHKSAAARGIVIKELKELYGEEFNEEEINSIPVTKELLNKQYKYGNKPLESLKKNEIKEQYVLMKFFSKLASYGQELNDLSMNLSVIQDMKVNFKDIHKTVDYFEKHIEFIPAEGEIANPFDGRIMTNLGPVSREGRYTFRSDKFDFSNLFTSAPHIFQAIASQRMLFKYLGDHMYIYNQNKVFTDRLNQLQSNISLGFTKYDREDYLRKEFIHFMATNTRMLDSVYNYEKQNYHPRYSNYLMTKVDSWAFDLAGDLEKVIMDNRRLGFSEKSNKFISALQINDRAAVGERVITFTNPPKSEEFYHMHEDFEKLDEDLKQRLVQYAIMFHGALFGTSNFVLAIPPHRYEQFNKDFIERMKYTFSSADNINKAMDVFETQVMINSYDLLPTFHKNVLTYSTNRSFELKNGRTIYYDMSHESSIEPQTFQLDKMLQEQRDDEKGEEIESALTETETEEQAPTKPQRLLDGKGNKYVARIGYNKRGKRFYTIYRRIDGIPDSLIPDDLINNTYYKKVATVKKFKYYTPFEPTLDYDLETAFDIRYPHEYMPAEGFVKGEVKKQLIKNIPYVEGQRVIGYSLDDYARENARLFEVINIKNVSIGGEIKEYTFKEVGKIPTFVGDTFYSYIDEAGSSNILPSMALAAGGVQIANQFYDFLNNLIC